MCIAYTLMLLTGACATAICLEYKQAGKAARRKYSTHAMMVISDYFFADKVVVSS